MLRFICLLIIVSLGSASCIQAGPAHPERDAPRYLKRHGYDEEVIHKVVEMEDMGDELFAKLAAERSTDVRFLVAQNPHLPRRLHEILLQDSDSLVRGGAALSPHLTDDQAREISRREDHPICLAQNPHVSDQILIDLHEKHGMELVWFAMNPECPEKLIQKMEATQDEDALYWLQTTREREAFKKQQREEDQAGL